jgi:hypothetical protein
MRSHHFFLITLLGLTIWSCEDPIDVELQEGPLQLVVDGRITDQDPVSLRLSTTAAYFDPATTPRVSNASIRLLENDETVDVLSESDTLPGFYSGSYIGEVGKRYQIEIEIPDGEAFEAGTWKSRAETIRPIFTLDSIYTTFFQQAPLPFGNYLNFKIQEGFDFPQNTAYRIRRTLNDSLFFQDFLFANTLEDLLSFQFRPLINSVLDSGDVVDLEFSSLSLRHREFLQILAEQINPGGLFAPPPAPIRGNVQELGGDERVALGYFGASAVLRVRYVELGE